MSKEGRMGDDGRNTGMREVGKGMLIWGPTLKIHIIMAEKL